jgi:hypothetical protein
VTFLSFCRQVSECYLKVYTGSFLLTFFPIYFSLIVITFDSIYTELLTESSNKSQTNKTPTPSEYELSLFRTLEVVCLNPCVKNVCTPEDFRGFSQQLQEYIMILIAKKFEVLWDATPCRLVNIYQLRGRHIQELKRR